MRAGRKRTRTMALLAVAALAAGGALLLRATDALERVELAGVDARQSIKGDSHPPRNLVVVGVDDETFNRLHLQWPFPRALHARVLDRLRRAGARTIAYDVQFSEPGRNEDDDLALFDAVAAARGRVVLGTSETDPAGRASFLGSNRNLRDAHGVAGNANFPNDRDNVFRRMPYSIEGLQSFAVAGARLAGTNPPKSRFKGKGAWIDYAGPAGTVKTIPFWRVAGGQFDPAAVRGKIVVVGATANSLQDVHATTAGGGPMPGPEIQANAIATILSGFPLREVAGWVAVLLVIALSAAAPLAAIAIHRILWIAVPVALGALYVVAAQIAFDQGWIVPVADPLAGLVLGLLGALAVTGFLELLERQRVRAVFGRFVPEQVVDQLVERADEDLRLGGTRMEGTVLFCDLRGFTHAAEHMEAEQVIEVLNRYLTEMSDAILDHGGAVVSYMGDGIMAVFGAPIEQPDHADRGLAAARDMAGGRLERFNAWAGEHGVGDSFAMGIGLCSGPVMSGNVGSERRLEYTAVGDTTNTAARLEAMTKESSHTLYVSGATRSALSEVPSDLVEVGELDVRGREATMKVWTLRGQG